MKMFWKNEDRVIDNLLRASTRGRSGPDAACRQFDPDLANAYIERSLTAKERAGYEGHLSECHACRSSIVALARMAEVETAPVIRAQPNREAGRFATLKGLFTPSAMPRLAAAALAIIVLAIGVPLLLSQEDSALPGERASSEVANDQTAKGVDNSNASPVASAPAVSRSDPAQASTAVNEDARSARREQEKAAAAEGESAQPKPTSAETGAGAAGADLARVEPSQPEKTEPKSAVAKSAEAKSAEARSTAESSNQTRKAESDAQAAAKEPSVAPPASRVAEEQSPLGQISAEDARRLRRDDKGAVSVTIKPGLRGGVAGLNKEERSAIRPVDAVAPPSQNTPAGSGERRGLAQPPRATRDDAGAGSAGFAARGSAMRKVGSKKFWLFKDVWTDKDYNPNKEMPVVTIERDSDIYKEMLTKRSGLKLYLMGFGEGERAIFVYKGTVYRLVPQNSR